MLQNLKFLDSDYFPDGANNVRNQARSSKPSRWIPFALLHLGCLLVFVSGYSNWAALYAIFLYLVRMFAITGFYHRYFSHKTFRTSRTAQFIFAVIGSSAVQRGPLWWAAHHRHHHQFSDKDPDVHSPSQRGFLWAHIGWITSDSNMPTAYERVPDLAKFEELRLLNRFDWVVPVLLILFSYGMGEFVAHLFPSSGTNGFQFVSWGILSTVVLFHATACINSLAHELGTQTFETGDESKNNFLLALITFGEGWHNNHHRYPGLTRQGLHWWQIDLTYYVLLLMEKLGIIWDLHKVPPMVTSSEFEPVPVGPEKL